MKIEVKNLGAIGEGTIDLSKKLTVFCGPNSTGKTYAAFIIYALIKNVSFGIELKEDYLKQIITENKVEIKLDFNEIWKFRSDQVKRVNQNLWNTVFAVAEKDKEKFFGETEINIIESEEEFNKKLDNLKLENFTLKIDEYLFTIDKQVGKSINISIAEDLSKDGRFERFLEIALLSNLYSLLAFYPVSSTTIFPVERSSVYTFSKELSIKKHDALEHLQALKDNRKLDLIDSFFNRSARYPQPVRDILKISEDLWAISQRNSPYYKFAEEIETNLLKGKIVISKYGQVEFVSDRAKSLRLSFHQSSSIVKTLASLVIYLKHLATENDLIIIDEPELNLHPDNQILLTRIFAHLIKKGLRLIISTHSDYIIRELNNLIIVGQSDERGNEEVKKIATEKGYKPEEGINPQDIGAYMFNYKITKFSISKKTIVTPIKIDKNGFDVSTINESITIQNEIADELAYAIKYGKEDE